MDIWYIQRYWWKPESLRNYITDAYSKVDGNTKAKQKIDGPLSLSFLILNSVQFFLPNTQYNLLCTQKYFLQHWMIFKHADSSNTSVISSSAYTSVGNRTSNYSGGRILHAYHQISIKIPGTVIIWAII